MNIMEAIRQRHSVRKYTVAPIVNGTKMALEREIEYCNDESSLRIQLVTDDHETFFGGLAHYGGFENVRNYIALIGPDHSALDEKCGYYGQRLVLLAQTLGLNTCWVGLTFKKRKVRHLIGEGERLVAVIAVGYGMNDGTESFSKTPDQVTKNLENAPLWFRYGVDAALMAPTSWNSQKFCIEWLGVQGEEGKYLLGITSTAGAKKALDLGIVRYNFEVAVGEAPYAWINQIGDCQ